MAVGRVCYLSPAEIAEDEREMALRAAIDAFPGATPEERSKAYFDAHPNPPELMELDLSVDLRTWAKTGTAKQQERRVTATSQGASLRALRVELGLTQAEAATRMGIARTTVVAIEQGKRLLRDDEVAKLRGGQ